jgi:hypothetical protein
MPESLSHHHHPKVITMAKRQWWLTLSAALSFALILLGAATLVFIQKPIQESQDLRQQASVDDGLVLMGFSPTTGSTLTVDEPASIEFQVNTQNVQIDGVQLIFNIITETISEPPEFVLANNPNLRLYYQEVEQVDDGYLMTVVVTAPSAGQSISTATLTPIGSLQFTPTSTGSLQIDFDEETSISTVYHATPPVDELLHIDTLNYTVSELASASPTTSPSPSATVEASASPATSPSPSATIQASASPATSPSPTAIASPTPTPDSGNGTGGVVSCNQSCSSNDQCEANHRCYQGQCRLVTNVSSTSCTAASTADNGLNRSCNQYCADSRECAAGYSCYYNRCRNPLNVESTSCSAPSQQVAQSMSASCNQNCSSHKDCAANLFCHSTGTCRLVTNPASTRCTPAIYSTVSNLYGNKGGSTAGQTKTDGVSPSSTTKPSSATTSASPRVTSSPQPGTSGDDLPLQKKSALQTLIDSVNNELSRRGISLPMFLIALGLGLLALVVILSLIMRALSRGNKPPMIVPVGRDRDKEKDAKYESQLASKINSLQQAPTTKPVTPPVTSGPVVPPSAMVQTPGTPGPTSTPTASTSAPTPTEPTSPPASGMMARLQDKGIKPPQG